MVGLGACSAHPPVAATGCEATKSCQRREPRHAFLECLSMNRARLEQMLADELRHLTVRSEVHFHIAVATDNENEWELPRFVSSPPYRQRGLAEQDARDPRLLTKVPTGFDVQVLECSRTCPRSALGHFGWKDEETGSFRWWDAMSWKVR